MKDTPITVRRTSLFKQRGHMTSMTSRTPFTFHDQRPHDAAGQVTPPPPASGWTCRRDSCWVEVCFCSSRSHRIEQLFEATVSPVGSHPAPVMQVHPPILCTNQVTEFGAKDIFTVVNRSFSLVVL